MACRLRGAQHLKYCIDIIHPGPATPRNYLTARGTAIERRVDLMRGQTLMSAVAEILDAEGCQSGVIVLDGAKIGPYQFVMPDLSKDGVHAAWYSPTHDGSNATIIQGTAIAGKRDGAWWLHAHALWNEDGASLAGHLLPDKVTVCETTSVTLHAFRGGAFDVQMNAETLFPIFHPIGGRQKGNAVIAKVNPFHDITASIREIAAEVGFASATVLGVGSVIGARFLDASPPMLSTISEVFFMAGSGVGPDRIDLKLFCVDPENGQYQGLLAPGTSPVCVTFELMLIEHKR